MITVVLPAYNEEEALPPLLAEIERVRSADLPDLRAIVVDDGSADSTAEIVRAWEGDHPWVRLAQHAQNSGLSQAIQTGFETALAEADSADAIVTMDADNTQPPTTIPALIAGLEAGADVVIASRFRPGARVYGVPLMRRLYSQAMSALFGIVFPIRGVRDYSCGFRAYRAGVLQRAAARYGADFITEQGFACMVEILFQLDHLDGVVFGEVPFALHYDQKPTATKMKVGRTIGDTLRVAFRHRFGRARSR